MITADEVQAASKAADDTVTEPMARWAVLAELAAVSAMDLPAPQHIAFILRDKEAGVILYLSFDTPAAEAQWIRWFGAEPHLSISGRYWDSRPYVIRWRGYVVGTSSPAMEV